MTSGRSRLRWAAGAERDLREIWSYYAAEATRDAADKIVAQINATAIRLTEHPFSGRPRDELRPRLRSILVHPYVIFYRVSEGEVNIARVLHERRNLPSVLKRD